MFIRYAKGLLRREVPLPLALCALASFLGASVSHAFSPSKPNPILPKEKLVITSGAVHHDFDVELAKTPKEQETGEMFRKSIAPGSGMLFPWRFPQRSEMWMKNTEVPLDIVFIGMDRKIESITEDAVPYSLTPIASHGPVLATLELPAGTVVKDKIFVGDEVSSPTLQPPKMDGDQTKKSASNNAKS